MPSSLSPDAFEDPASEDADLNDSKQSGFADLGLSEPTLEILAGLGFSVPTAIQEAAIPELMAGRDVVGVAQTGTGKTAAFGLPLLEFIDPNLFEVQALVLAPTRELALQTAQALEQFGRTKGQVIAVYGGAPYGPQLQALRRGAQIVVGTPGRIIDLIEKKNALDLSAARFFVLDEADEMLRMGFAEDVELIAQSLPSDRLTALFSATMPPAIEGVARSHLQDPVRLEVSAPASTVDTIRQTYAVVPPKFRFEALTRVLAVRDGGATIVFVKTRQEAEEVSLDLAGEGFRAAGISGDVVQSDRERLVDRLRHGTLDVLVATDVAARGLDVERIGLVVNYDVPREREAYVHRIGRTGRAGREGESLTFFGPRDRYQLRQIERLTGERMEEVRIPTRNEVLRVLAARKLRALPAPGDHQTTEILSEALNQELSSGISLHDLALRLLAELVGANSAQTTRPKSAADAELDDAGYFVSAEFAGPERKAKGLRRDRRGEGHSHRGRPGSQDVAFDHRYRIEVGRKDGVTPGAIVGAIAGEGGLSGANVGHINIFPSFSLVELSEGLSANQVRQIGRATVRGRKLRISEDSGPLPRSRGGKPAKGRKKR